VSVRVSGARGKLRKLVRDVGKQSRDRMVHAEVHLNVDRSIS
jgi:hypothetical protein